jgi:hypothetical protein
MKQIKKIGVILMLLIICAIFFINSQTTKAAQTSTCEWTNDNNFCVESTDQNFAEYNGCKEGYKDLYQTVDQIDNCKIGTCVPNGAGSCLSNTQKIACIKNNTGSWSSEQLANVQACQKGCCNVANSFCAIRERKVCIQDVAHGNQNAFNGNIIDKNSCDDSCRTADKGCCQTGDTFKFTTRASCSNGIFNTDIQCRDVPGYNAISHKYKSCGDGTENNDGYDVYWYDSKGIREDLAESCGADKYCVDPDGKGGADATCVSTSCVDSCPDCYPGQLRSGESVCLNMMNSFNGNDRRTTALDNYILRCQYGEISPDNTAGSRTKFCQDSIGNDGRINAQFINNNYQSCSDCGKGSTTDIAGFVPLIGPPIAAGALFGLGNACHSKWDGWTLGLGDKCENQGDCYYDRDFIWSPIGSCNPIYTPGTTDKCGECGKGGDSATNLCTKKECNSLGNCQFQKKYTSENVIAAGGLAIGTCAAGWVLSSVLCNAWITAPGCPAWAEGAKTLCTHIGSHTLFWGIVGTVYGIGASTATADTEVPDNILINGKTPISVSLAMANGMMQNLTTDENQLGKINSGEGGNFASGTVKATLPLFTKVSATYIKNAIFKKTLTSALNPTEFGEILSTLKVDPELKNFMVDRFGAGNFINKITVALVFVQLSTSFETGTCSTETAYTDNSHCEECGAGEAQWYCTKERCGILGETNGHCRYIPTNGTALGKCVAINSNDVSPPIINKISAKFLDDNNNLVNQQYGSNTKTLVISDKLTWDIVSTQLTINTDERARCTFINTKNKEFSEGATFDDESYQTEHSTEINLTESDKVNGLTLYFKCEDLNGNKINKADDTNYIQFSFLPRPDEYPPQIIKINPKGGLTPLPESITTIPLELVTYDGEQNSNDIAECRYTKSNSTNYDEYEGIFTRGNKINCLTTNSTNCRLFSADLDLTGWGSNITNANQTLIYYMINIKCKDTTGNVMNPEQNWVGIIQRTFDLTINSPVENQQTYNRTLFINVTTTSDTICNYTIDNSNNQITLSNTYESEHTLYDESILSE